MAAGGRAPRSRTTRGGGEPIFGGEHGVEVRQPAPFRRGGRSKQDRDGRHVGLAHLRRRHRASAAANANGGTGSRTPSMQQRTLALFYMFYNFARIHQTLRVTPAMEAGVSNHVWTLEEIAELVQDDEVVILK